jgi:CheY-like chemotaxis protein
LWRCLGDRQQIDQVFDNLLLNARQAMANQGEILISAQNVTLDAASNPALAPGRYLRISVADQGPGVAKDMQGRIFEPFFTTKIKGTGLGLATTHSIVRKHKGHIEVSSEPGKGAIFTVILPADEAEPQATQQSPTQGARALRVLLLDDEPTVRSTLVGMLSELGHTVSAVADGDTAVETFRAAHAAGQPFDLALLDLTIPNGAGGREVLQQLLAIEPTLRAIALSGTSANTSMSKSVDHGFMGRLSKPCTIDELALLVGRANANQG